MRPVLEPLAAAWRRTLVRRTRVVAVVGSFGKTTTSRAVAAALGLRTSRFGGFNAGVALATALLQVRPGASHAVFEVGISGPGQMAGPAALIRPDVVVVTSIGSEHLSSFRTLETTREEKAVMIAALPPSGVAILNGDDPNVLWMRGKTKARVVTFGFGEANDVRASRIEVEGESGTRFALDAAGRSFDVRIRLIGRHMVASALAAVAVVCAEGGDLDLALERLRSLEPTANRLQPIRLASGAVVLLDAYKAAVETIQGSLEALAAYPARRRIVVLGDVEEPPSSQGPVYRDVGLRIASVADLAFFVGGKTNHARLRIGTSEGGLTRDALVRLAPLPKLVAARLEAEARVGDVILIKGRSTEHFERIALLLMGKDVACAARVCRRRHDCESCPLVRRT